MNTRKAPTRDQSKRIHYPRWAVPITLTLAFLLVHVIAPWGLSELSTRYGWVDRRPGPWNLLALILVIPGLAATIWMITVHYRASPDTFLEWKPGQKLITPGPYAFSRNPMYLSELVLMFGWVVLYGNIVVLLGFLAWWGLFVFYQAPLEERIMQKRFGEIYLEYKRKVPRWYGNVRN